MVFLDFLDKKFGIIDLFIIYTQALLITSELARNNYESYVEYMPNIIPSGWPNIISHCFTMGLKIYGGLKKFFIFLNLRKDWLLPRIIAIVNRYYSNKLSAAIGQTYLFIRKCIVYLNIYGFFRRFGQNI